MHSKQSARCTLAVTIQTIVLLPTGDTLYSRLEIVDETPSVARSVNDQLDHVERVLVRDSRIYGIVIVSYCTQRAAAETAGVDSLNAIFSGQDNVVRMKTAI